MLPLLRYRSSTLNGVMMKPCGGRFMSVRPAEKDASKIVSARKKVTIQRLRALAAEKIPITVLTAYDYPTGLRSERNDIDICLVGDSLAQVALGYDSTTRLTLEEMIHHCKAVSRAVKTPMLVADMPFGSFHAGLDETVRNAVRLVRDGCVEAVKVEGGFEVVPAVERLTSLGIPVMGHVGLTPQRHTALSGFRVQGRDATPGVAIFRAAQALQEAGAFSVVIEAVPHLLAGYITQQLDIPTIGIGAGSETSGQVLVHDDALGVWSGHKAKFVRRFAEVGVTSNEGVAAYARAVRSREFPSEVESYAMNAGQWEEFEKLTAPDSNSGP
ncbi:hypothetical protein FRB96_001899 [Tulasnella sp. 330]|nr:hypothetical protein FRB96_001899 [Tulasnella sp. 330]KAG8883593.1 hypothetical protein FRB97_006287 [Tulasnella sp. 331]KAG8888957.1 hypothetical protein FRB98_006355 [Tulasnella sp. 332]